MNNKTANSTLTGIHIKHSRGFTLIELIIVVAIIAILAGIGYPMYAEQVRKARRSDAQGALYGLSNAMEQYAAINPNTGYTGAAIGAGGIFPNEAPLDGQDKYYNLVVAIIDADSDGYGEGFTLTASPKDKMAGDACGIFSLTSTGARSVTGSGTCWK